MKFKISWISSQKKGRDYYRCLENMFIENTGALKIKCFYEWVYQNGNCIVVHGHHENLWRCHKKDGDL